MGHLHFIPINFVKVFRTSHHVRISWHYYRQTEENYEKWNECLKSYFIANVLWDVVNGDYKKPEESEANYKDWARKNAMALHAIQISYKEETMSALIGNESANYESELLAPNFVIGKPEIAEEGNSQSKM
ncbi:hypothetical protein Pint_27204 [Pistacia integerrima]|uniref:Uncharacterized protein n=1 Tax=Pistacia integerrima TaxID=434235 RepID=A0ACC0YQ85_9ROSI|nr:hypothetical protein Pint_27204 [Pistacia integerrima]